MEREIDLAEISDGRLYTANDMVKIGCNDCKGCSECCRVVGDTIILDPYDIYQLECGLQTDFSALMHSNIELRVVDGITLPNLKIRPNGEGCSFLSEEGRCTIHGYRPGFCRMFPMGRIYENGGFHYFLQVQECTYPNKSKIQLKKWMGIPELAKYEKFVLDWHDFLKKVQGILQQTENQDIARQLNVYLLNQFYVTPYITDLRRGEDSENAFDYYSQFYNRLKAAEEMIQMYR